MGRSVIIIGAGIAGLAAGCYAQMNGYRSQVFELHNLPGGLCTAWRRGEYVFDGCLHYLFGSAPGRPYHRLWEELGAVQGRRMIDHDELMRVLDADGRTLIAYCDPDRLEAHLLEHSPADAPRIRAMAAAVRAFCDFDMSILQEKPRELMSVHDWRALGRKMTPFLKTQLEWGRHSAASLARTFRDPFLQKAVSQMFGWSEIPMTAALSLLAYMHLGNASFPAGASLAFAQAIEKRYLDLGGRVHYRSRVERVLVEEDRAVGVRLYTDEEHRADHVISAADGRTTIFGMLGGRYLNRGLERLYHGGLPLRPQVQVSLGVNRDLSREPHWVTHLLDEPITVAGELQPAIGVKHYGFDPSLAPPGKSVVIIALPADYEYWRRIYGHRLYDSEQTEVSQLLIDWLERHHPGIAAQVERVDEATPLSHEHFTGNWQGSTCGWLLTDKTMPLMLRGVRKTLPGLRNFFMAGQWVEPGGSVPVVAMSGRNAVQLLCHADKQPFVTTTP